MRLANAFGTSKDLELNGKWMDIYDPSDGSWMFSCKLGRYGGSNTNLSVVRERVMADYRHLPKGALDKDLGAKLGMQVFAEACCLDWAMPAEKADLLYPEDLPASSYVAKGHRGKAVRGVEQADGKVAPFSVESLCALFEAVPNIFDLLIGQSTDFAFFKSAQQEADSKN